MASLRMAPLAFFAAPLGWGWRHQATSDPAYGVPAYGATSVLRCATRVGLEASGDERPSLVCLTCGRKFSLADGARSRHQATSGPAYGVARVSRLRDAASPGRVSRGVDAVAKST